MKEFIMGIAMILLASIFLTFQVDINLYQRQMEFVHVVAEEAAATAALEIAWGDSSEDVTALNYANGFIKFDENAAGAAGTNIVVKNLKLDSAFKSTNTYFEENMTVMLYVFDQNGTYSKFVNGVKTVAAAPYSKGENFSVYCESPYKEMVASLTGLQQIKLNYPSTICIINAGKPQFRDSFGLENMANDIVKIGFYEYKYFE